MALDHLFRSDCPAYNDALLAAFRADPTLTTNEGRAAAVAADLYEKHFHLGQKLEVDGIRSELLLKLVSNFEASSWLHRDPREGAYLWWGISGIIDTVDLSDQEHEQLAKAFQNFDFHNDIELGQASFRALSTRHTVVPPKRYQQAAIRLARRQAQTVLAEHLQKNDPQVRAPRKCWRDWLDQWVMAVG